MSNPKNNAPAESTPEKAMTKYDRKMQARREAELREKKRSLLTRITAIVILVLVVVIAIAVPVSKRISAKQEYVRIGNHSINEIEYGFYYGYSVNTFLSNYASILPYMGLDTTADFSTQMFDEDTTWAQYFNQLTLNNVQQYLALADDAEAKNYEYDFDTNYNDFYASMEEAATEEGISLNSYLKQVFGDYATKANLKSCVTTFLTAQSYYMHLYESNTPSAEEISAHYAENKDDYDNFDYRVFGIAASTTTEATEEDVAAAMAASKETADAFAARVEAGEDFKTLCAEYATEENKESYTGDNDISLKENVLSSSISSLYSEWMLAEDRTAGDVTVIEDSENLIYYVVTFLSRDYDAETQDQNISDTLASEATQEYVTGLMEGYSIVDEKDNIDLPIISSAEETTGTDESADTAAE